MAVLDGKAQLQRTRAALYHAEIQFRQYCRLLSDNEHFQMRHEAVCYSEGCVFFVGQAYRSLLRELAAFYRLDDVASVDELEQILAAMGVRAPEIQLIRAVQTNEDRESRVRQSNGDPHWWPDFAEHHEQLFRPAYQAPKQAVGVLPVQGDLLFRSRDVDADCSVQLRIWLDGMTRLVDQVRASIQEW